MSLSTPTGPARVDPAEVSLVSLLVALSAEHPDLDRHTIARAVERAAATAEVLNPGLRTTQRQIEMFARDRLDAATGSRARTRRRNPQSSADRDGCADVLTDDMRDPASRLR